MNADVKSKKLAFAALTAVYKNSIYGMAHHRTIKATIQVIRAVEEKNGATKNGLPVIDYTGGLKFKIRLIQYCEKRISEIESELSELIKQDEALKLNDKPIERTPVLNGLTYCSPACGCGCTKSAYDFAKHKSEWLASYLGYGWAPVVWENCGWHYKASKGAADVYPTSAGDGMQWACMVDNATFAHAETPELAVSFALDKIQKETTRLIEIAMEIQKHPE